MMPNQRLGPYEDEKMVQASSNTFGDHSNRNQETIPIPTSPPLSLPALSAPQSLHQDSHQYQPQPSELLQGLDYDRSRRRIMSSLPSPSRHWAGYMNEIYEANILRRIRMEKGGEENIDDFLRRFPIE